MPINLDKFKGRGSDADGATKKFRDPVSGQVLKQDSPGSVGAPIKSISGQVDKAAGRVVDNSSNS